MTRLSLTKQFGAMCCRIATTTMAVTLMAAVTVSTQLPSPTSQNLRRFGYYFVNEQWGNDTQYVWPYTNIYVSSPYNAVTTDTSNWWDPFTEQLHQATINHKAVYLILGECVSQASEPSCATRNISWDQILTAAAPYWGQVNCRREVLKQ